MKMPNYRIYDLAKARAARWSKTASVRAGARRPRGRGRGGGAKEGGEFVVPSGIMSRAMYLTLKAGGAPAVPQRRPRKRSSRRTSRLKKQTDAGHAAPRRTAAETRRRVGGAPVVGAGAAGARVRSNKSRRLRRAPARDAPRPYPQDFRHLPSQDPPLSVRCATAPSPSAGRRRPARPMRISRWSRPVKMPMAKYKPPKATLFHDHQIDPLARRVDQTQATTD